MDADDPARRVLFARPSPTRATPEENLETLWLLLRELQPLLERLPARRSVTLGPFIL